MQARLSGEHVRRAVASVFIRRLEQYHVDEGDQDGGGTALRVDNVRGTCRVFYPLDEHQQRHVEEQKH